MGTSHRVFFAALAITMMVMTTLAMAQAGFSEAAAELVRNPWGRLTIVDAYGAILSFYLLTVWGEKSVLQRIVWLALFVGLGSLAIALYALFRLPRRDGAEI